MNKVTNIHARDIPVEPILRLLAQPLNGKQNAWYTHWFGFDNSIGPALPDAVIAIEVESQREKLILAKLRKMADQGLINGCACGCRGDWTITPQGLDLLK